MNSEIENIIVKLKEGDLQPQKAVKLINQHNYSDLALEPSCSKLKIIIYSKEDNKTIRIPSIPFWFITSLGNAGLTITKFITSKSDSIDDKTKQYLSILDDFDLRDIFKELRSYGPFDLVNLEEKDGDVIRISVL